mgnify:CR=1 FL=1
MRIGSREFDVWNPCRLMGSPRLILFMPPDIVQQRCSIYHILRYVQTFLKVEDHSDTGHIQKVLHIMMAEDTSLFCRLIFPQMF